MASILDWEIPGNVQLVKLGSEVNWLLCVAPIFSIDRKRTWILSILGLGRKRRVLRVLLRHVIQARLTDSRDQKHLMTLSKFSMLFVDLIYMQLGTLFLVRSTVGDLLYLATNGHINDCSWILDMMFLRSNVADREERRY